MNSHTKYLESVLTSTTSLNNRLIVEVYTKEALRSDVRNGIAFVDQKTTLKGLKILVDAKLNDGTIVQSGSTAYIKEEKLHADAWAQKILKSNSLQEPFLIVDLHNVEFIEPRNTASDFPLLYQCKHEIYLDGICASCRQPRRLGDGIQASDLVIK